MRLIDADELKEAIKEWRYHGYYDKLIEVIDNAPTVEPFEPDYVGAERLKARQRGFEEGYRMGKKIGKTLNPKIKQGEWEEIKTNPPFLDHRFYICSECGREIDVITSDESLDDYPYCHCGADMRKEAKE